MKLKRFQLKDGPQKYENREYKQSENKSLSALDKGSEEGLPEQSLPPEEKSQKTPKPPAIAPEPEVKTKKPGPVKKAKPAGKPAEKSEKPTPSKKVRPKKKAQ